MSSTFKYRCDDDCRSERCPAALERIAAGWRNGRDIMPNVKGAAFTELERQIIKYGFFRQQKRMEEAEESFRAIQAELRRALSDEAIIAAFSAGGSGEQLPTHQPHAPFLTNEQIVWVVRRFLAGA